MRILSAIMGVLLMVFTAVQYNDPDALYWGAIYGLAALWCFFAATSPATVSGTPFNVLLGISGLAALVGVIFYWPKTPGWWSQAVWWETETVREGMGMMITFAATAVAAATAFLARPRQDSAHS